MTAPVEDNTATPEIELHGPPRQRGRVHGEQFRDLIAESIERWQQTIGRSYDLADLIEKVMNQTRFLAAAQKHAPHLVDEVRGIAEGADQTFEMMLAWQLIDELWWYKDQLTGDLVPLERCSAMAVNHGGRGIVAQTQDLDCYYDGGQVMLRYIEEDGLEILAPSVAGLLALNGVNSAGLAVCITTLSPLAHSPDGVGSGFIVPMLLRCRSIEEGIALLQRLPRASGNSYTLGSRHASAVMETSSTDVVIADQGDRVLRTNHPQALQPVWEHERFRNSRDRYSELEQTVRPDSSVEDLLGMYATGQICRSRASAERFMTVGTMIFELGDRQSCHYAPGPLDTDPVTTYRMAGVE